MKIKSTGINLNSLELLGVQMMMTFYKLLTTCCVIVVVCALTAFVGIELLPASDMRMWGIRSFAYQSLGWCCVAYFGIMLGFLLLRKWRKLFMAFGLAVPLIVAFILGSLSIGPSIRWIREKTACATGVPFCELVCVGGRISRESVVVFEVKCGTSPKIIGEEVDRQDETTCAIILHALSFVHVEIPASAGIVIRRFHEEFNTVFMVDILDKQYAIFFGQSVM